MNVNGITQGASAAAVQERSGQSNPKAKTSDTQSPDTSSSTAATVSEKSPGVVRLLEEGHFKGVADVRLRINFFEELEAGNAAAAALPEGAAALVSDVGAALDALAQSGEVDADGAALVEEAKATFSSAVQGAVDAFTADPAADSADVLGAFQDAFGSLLESLASLEGTTEEGTESPLLSYVQDLHTAFEKDFSGLQPSLVDTLPPLSSPQGNGGAYEKFLAMYQSLAGAADSTEGSPPIDTMV